ncbi:MAG: hypothetical protein RL563_268 [Pseudomonadota bacterium]|jgi:poly-beta-1,6-N-acetyl-D-glucosamine biosynthesis protein PgaD
MKEIIINQPHLQSLSQRLGSVFLATISWLLWLYFLLPLFTLGAWLLGLKSLSDEIRWFGGYKTLLQLLELYGEIVLIIAIAWAFWTFCLSWIHAMRAPKNIPVVSKDQLCESFQVDMSELETSKLSQNVTVHFDEHADILHIYPD